jgi:polyferredoxin
VATYTLTHTATLSFVTLALVNIILPFDIGSLNPVIPSWHVDESAICRDIDAGFGWDEEWLIKCSKHFYTVMLVVAWCGLLLMFAQWWALWTVRRWGKELRFQKLRADMDVEKMGLLDVSKDRMMDEKTHL